MPFGFGPDLWNEDPASGSGGPNYDPNYDTVVSTNSYAPSVRTESELAAAIKAQNGKLVVHVNDSDMIVAVNNQLRFSLNRNANGDYEITDRFASNNTLLWIGGGALVLVLVIAMAGR